LYIHTHTYCTHTHTHSLTLKTSLMLAPEAFDIRDGGTLHQQRPGEVQYRRGASRAPAATDQGSRAARL